MMVAKEHPRESERIFRSESSLSSSYQASHMDAPLKPQNSEGWLSGKEAKK